MSVRVLLTPETERLAGSERVMGCTIRLTGTGAGPNPTSEVAATIEIHELPEDELETAEADAHTDAVRAPTLLATLRGRLRMNGDDPLFTFDEEQAALDIALYDEDTGEASSDVYLNLYFDNGPSSSSSSRRTQTFARVPYRAFYKLYLPWDAVGEGDDYELKGTVHLAGEVHAAPELSGALQVPTFHPRAVREEGRTDEPRWEDAYGVPTLSRADYTYFGDMTLPIGSSALVINIDAAVLTAGGLGQDRVTDHLTEAFQDTGFRLEVAWKTARQVSQLWHGFSGYNQVCATSEDRASGSTPIALDAIDGITDNGLDDDRLGNDMPFFTHWVVSTPDLTIANVVPTACALSEGRNECYGNKGVDVASGKKRVMTPIQVGGDKFRTIMTNPSNDTATTTAARERFLANLIAHEVGHNLGLPHTLGNDLRPAPLSIDLMAKLGPQRQRFSPVAKAIFQSRYGVTAGSA